MAGTLAAIAIIVLKAYASIGIIGFFFANSAAFISISNLLKRI